MKQNFRTLMFGIDNKEKKEEEVTKKILVYFQTKSVAKQSDLTPVYKLSYQSTLFFKPGRNSVLYIHIM